MIIKRKGGYNNEYKLGFVNGKDIFGRTVDDLINEYIKNDPNLTKHVTIYHKNNSDLRNLDELTNRQLYNIILDNKIYN